MITLVFATHNSHKVEEIQLAIGSTIRVISLSDAGIEIDIPEPHDTLEANAREKSRIISSHIHMNCFGEDTGLEVQALNGEPGVKSARYAGEERDFEKNIDKLLLMLRGHTNRRARFRTVISLIYEGKEFQFEGICEGVIIDHKRGSNGFGYDPVFMPSGTNLTFAEMDVQQKSQISHRKKAADKLVLFLQQLTVNTGTT